VTIDSLICDTIGTGEYIITLHQNANANQGTIINPTYTGSTPPNPIVITPVEQSPLSG
jgi:hypothetical protein